MNNTQTQHTPGPWTTKRDAVPAWHVQIGVYAEPSGERIATVFGGEANANLIAANPDLLEALKELLDQLEGIGIPEWHGAEGLCLNQARAAIAKAEGGAS